MATKKAASTRKATARKPAAAKKKTTTARAAAKPATTTKVVSSSAAAAKSSRRREAFALPKNIVNIVFAELIGTFVLTLAVLFAADTLAPLYVGLTFAVVTVAVGAVSGAHVNPALSFGLWTMRRLKSVLLPFYWGAQLLGAMIAVIVINWITNGSISLDFGHLWLLDWSMFGVEMVGAAVFMFIVAAAMSHREMTATARAFGVGLALTVGLVVAGTLHNAVKSGYDTSKWMSVTDIEHGYRVKGPSLNPATALAQTEQTDASFTGASAADGEKEYSRFTSEVVLGTLVGAAVGGNLYLLVAGAGFRRKAS